ncbi:peroxiredoxin family protein [Aquiflexum sp.]|uniref:peroxiredoxin family protein n=1 Tax=Aquiflexum sp. TaxID=1872584 RepID=UPI003594413B
MTSFTKSIISEKSPEFKIKDYLGNTLSLTDYKGQKIMLSFFRGASCPFCNMRVRELIQSYGKFQERKIAIIAVFAATAEEIAQYAGKQKAPFPIVPDPKLDLYRLYGVESSSKGMYRVMLQPVKMMKMMFSGFFNMKSIKEKPILPADFLIDEGLHVSKIYQGKDFGDHIPLEEVLNWDQG